MSKMIYPHVNAAFINALAEEGTKTDCLKLLQEQWNETCYLRRRLIELSNNLKSNTKE